MVDPPASSTTRIVNARSAVARIVGVDYRDRPAPPNPSIWSVYQDCHRPRPEIYRTRACPRLGVAGCVHATRWGGARGAIGAGADGPGTGTGLFQPCIALPFGEAQDAPAGAVALLGGRPVGEDGFHGG